MSSRLPKETLLSLDGGPCFARMSLAEARVTMRTYEEYSEERNDSDGDAAPFYIFDYRALEPASKFSDGTPLTTEFDTPTCFKNDVMEGISKSRFRPLPPAWLLVGSARSGTPIHDHPLTVA